MNSESTPPADSSDLGTCRALIVDDNHDAADMLALAFTTFGHTAQVAYDGPSALKLVESFTPDVALLDIGLPMMDGYELGRRFRKLPALEHIFMVALTGYGNDRDRELALQAGFDAHLLKPVDIHELDKLVRERVIAMAADK